jgi:hypothetical protein
MLTHHVAPRCLEHYRSHFNCVCPTQDARAFRQNTFDSCCRDHSPAFASYPGPEYLCDRVHYYRSLDISFAKAKLAFAFCVSQCRVWPNIPSNYYTRRNLENRSQHEATLERSTWAVCLPLYTPAPQPRPRILGIPSVYDSLGSSTRRRSGINNHTTCSRLPRVYSQNAEC